MKVEGIKMRCKCGSDQCKGETLTQLHLYAQDEKDAELLESLLAEFTEGATEPIRETNLTIDVSEIRKTAQEKRAKADAARNN